MVIRCNLVRDGGQYKSSSSSLLCRPGSAALPLPRLGRSDTLSPSVPLNLSQLTAGSTLSP
eukprot:2078909-Prymnesium_polylepis.1